MTDDQNARLNAYRAVETILDAHPAPLDAVPAAQRTIQSFRDRLDALRTAVRAQADYAPQGAAKDARLDALADAAVALSQAVAAWADDTGDLALADQIAFTRSDFTHVRGQDALDRAALVHDTAGAHLASLEEHGVTRDEVEALDALIDDFASAISQPRHAVAERVANTRAIETLFPEIDRLLACGLDRQVARFHGTPFHDEYRAARRVVDR